MIEFSLSIDLGKKERIGPSTESMPVDRAFVVQSLVAAAAKIQAGEPLNPHWIPPAAMI
jgi:hypothetical protein